MKIKLWLKIVILFIIVTVVLFVGFFTALISLIFGGDKFVTAMIIIISLTIIIFFVLLLFNIVKIKVLSLIFTVVVLLFTAICTIYGFYKSYINNIPKVTQEVNLREYQPFVKDSKAVKLESYSTFKINENLPKIDGANALYPLYSAFIQAVYPEKIYSIYESEVQCNNTINAYENLLNGKADLIFAARPSKDQIEKAHNKGIEFNMTSIGREAFVFFVNYKNSVENITIEQIQGIYTGEIRNWKERTDKSISKN